MKVKAALEVQWVQVSNPGSEYLCAALHAVFVGFQTAASTCLTLSWAEFKKKKKAITIVI